MNTCGVLHVLQHRVMQDAKVRPLSAWTRLQYSLAFRLDEASIFPVGAKSLLVQCTCGCSGRVHVSITNPSTHEFINEIWSSLSHRFLIGTHSLCNRGY